MRTTIIELEIHINISNNFSNFYENSQIFKFRTTYSLAKISFSEYSPTNFSHICKRNDMKISYRFCLKSILRNFSPDPIPHDDSLNVELTLHYTRTRNVPHYTCFTRVRSTLTGDYMNDIESTSTKRAECTLNQR